VRKYGMLDSAPFIGVSPLANVLIIQGSVNQEGLAGGSKTDTGRTP